MAEFLPLIRVKGGELFAVSVLNVHDCLDRARSTLVMDPLVPHQVVNVMRAVFDATKLPDDVLMFKVPEDYSWVFVSDAFLKLVEDNGLSGALVTDASASPFSICFPGLYQSVWVNCECLTQWNGCGQGWGRSIGPGEW